MSATDTFLKYQLLQLCQNAIETCPFTNPVAGADCTNKFCSGFPAYISVGTCVSLGEDPDNCCASSDPQTCLQNYAHGGTSKPTPNVCASVISILDDCFSLTPTLSPSANALISTSGPSATALASCVCYDTDGTYDPDALDGFASECAASGSAAHPTYFPLVTPLQGFCTNNVGVPGSAVASTTMQATPSSPTPVVATSTSASVAATTPILASSTTPVQGSSTSAAVSDTSSKVSTTAAAGAGSSPASTPSVVGATTTSKSSAGFKNTVRNSAVLVLCLSILINFH